MTLATPGAIRLAVLNGVGGAKLKTLWLPTPSKGTPEIEWVTKAVEKDILGGSERTRILGYIPTLTVNWKPYDERSGMGYTIGTSDGQRPRLEDLLKILSVASGTLKVSAGKTGGGFVVGRVKVGKVQLVGHGLGSVSVTFRGRDIVPEMRLEAF